MTSLTHHFLLAMPALTGSYFGDTVIYLCEHNESGAMGLIINRAGRMALADLASELNLPRPIADNPTQVLEGGPVSPEQGFVLHSDDQRYSSSKEIASGILLSSSPDAVAGLLGLNGPQYGWVAFGYAGWGAGQLEHELEQDSWLTVPASRSVLFDTSLDDRRRAAAATLGIDMRLMARTTGNA